MAQAPHNEKEVSDVAKAAIKKLNFTSIDDEPLKIIHIRHLEDDRRKIYSTLVPSLKDEKNQVFFHVMLFWRKKKIIKILWNVLL